MSEPGKNPASGSAPGPATPPAPHPAASPAETPITLQDFQRITLRTGVVVAAENHPNADRLLVLKVDIGEAQPRQLVASIRGTYQANELIGKQVVVVANLNPAMLRGVESQGMALAASDGSTIVVVTPERPVKPGSPVK
jgi:methionyl-tRNA synthetase